MFPSRTVQEPQVSTISLKSKEDAEAEIERLKQYVEDLKQKEESKKRASNVLVPCSPSPRKKKRERFESVQSEERSSRDQPSSKSTHRPTAGSSRTALQDSKNVLVARELLMTARPKSSLLDGMKAVRENLKISATVRAVPRNTSFLDPRPNPTRSAPITQQSPFCSNRIKASVPEHVVQPSSSRSTLNDAEPYNKSSTGLREADLTVRAEIPIGPVEFKPPIGDPIFSTLEPNSNVRLRQRNLSHEDLQDHLYGRHIVRINELYNIIRKLDDSKSKGGTEWDIPLIGDWVLFAVIGEKGDLKLTNPQNSQLPPSESKSLGSKQKGKAARVPEGEDDELSECLRRDEDVQQATNDAEFSSGRIRQRRHYINFKLIDMSSKSISQSGSGMINMILFEAEDVSSTDTIDINGNPTIHKVYRGGSGGAYEKFWKEQPGTLIAILNPKVINQDHMKKIHSIVIPMYLGNCTAKRLDTGKGCGNWCDLRISADPENQEDVTKSVPVCEFHLQRQINKTRAGRAEFFSSNSGMNKHVGAQFNPAGMRKHGQNGKAKFDPVKKTGLLPANKNGMRVIDGERTYVCPGNRSNPKNINPAVSKKPRWDEPIDTEKLDAIRRRRKREASEKELEESILEKDVDGEVKKNGNGEVKKNQSLGDQYLLDAKRLLKAKSEKLKGVDQGSSHASGSQSSSKAPTRARKTFDDTLVEGIGHNPTKEASTSNSKPKTEEESCNFLDLLGEEGPIRKLGPDTLSVGAKHGARQNGMLKKKTQVSLTLEEVSRLDKSTVDDVGKDDKDESDSDDSLIVLPPT
ncbi:uncharacterized protein MELLADRAFT_89687 [Melampsora larici-populina 98AG31]|uniref:Uncharacterized protein n=1 Tax=Melampsora larici-populina (strain 98AG31 / pathotype 3-4-7) TaxID=747676 RepID=F4RU92_MELLP|nr:uncharacterized protein MELLADRAFT_89687 [Melampsora larici-populina 98AG31]EGG03896.1 hypothetical protein MELLADRAFT_89687 [Melampsora larici-populina 98AG31]